MANLVFITDKTAAGARWFGIDLTEEVAAQGAIPAATLQSAVWTVPAGITKQSEQIIGNTALIRISGGTVGTSYLVKLQYTLDNGDSDGCGFLLKIEDL